MPGIERRRQAPSLLMACGSLLAALAIGLSAYAAHGVGESMARSHLETAALYAFGHGVALAALGPRSLNGIARLALYLLLLGVLLFAGSLVGAALMQWPTRLAPVGGTVLMVGWVLLGLSALKR